MWGKVESNKIVKIYSNPEVLIDAKGTVHPRSYFEDNTKLAEFNIYPVVNKNSIPSKQFMYIREEETYAWKSTSKTIEKTFNFTARALADVNEVWTQAEIDDGLAPSGTKANDGKKDNYGNQIVTQGLTNEALQQVRNMESSLLSETDKWVTRKAEKGTAIPSSVSTWRDGIRTAADNMNTKINAANTFDKLSALYDDEVNSDGTIKTNRVLYTFPSAPDGMPT